MSRAGVQINLNRYRHRNSWRLPRNRYDSVEYRHSKNVTIVFTEEYYRIDHVNLPYQINIVQGVSRIVYYHENLTIAILFLSSGACSHFLHLDDWVKSLPVNIYESFPIVVEKFKQLTHNWTKRIL